MTTKWYKFSTVRCRATFRNSGGDLADPTTVTLRVQDPLKEDREYTVALSEVTRESLGIFYRDTYLNRSGRWFFHYEGTGTVPAAVEGSLKVERSEF